MSPRVLEDELTFAMLLAYQQKWEFMPPPMVSLFMLATAHGYKPKAPAPKAGPLAMPTSPTFKPNPAVRAAELEGIAALFPTGVIGNGR